MFESNDDLSLNTKLFIAINNGFNCYTLSLFIIIILLYLCQEGGGPIHRGHPGFGQAALLKLLRADLADGRGAAWPGGPGASGQGSAMEESLEMFECNIWLDSIEHKLGFWSS